MVVRVRVRFPPEWEFVDRVRAFGGFFCAEAFAAETANRVQVVIQEALESALRHPGAATNREVELTIATEGKNLEVEITCLPGLDRIARLKRDVATVSSQMPQQAFVDALSQSSSDPASLECVGLARMRNEGGMDLIAEARQDGSLRFIAKGLL